MQSNIKTARATLEALQLRYQQAADRLTDAIAALKEAEETGEWAQERQAGLDAAKGLLTPEALKALDLTESARAKPSKRSVRDELLAYRDERGFD